MKKWLLSLTLLMSMTAVQADGAPKEVEDKLQQMVRENIISATEAEKAKIRLRSMNTYKIASRSPASIPSQNRVDEMRSADLEGAQFKQIQNEVKRIYPYYK